MKTRNEILAFLKVKANFAVMIALAALLNKVDDDGNLIGSKAQFLTELPEDDDELSTLFNKAYDSVHKNTPPPSPVNTKTQVVPVDVYIASLTVYPEPVKRVNKTTGHEKYDAATFGLRGTYPIFGTEFRNTIGVSTKQLNSIINMSFEQDLKLDVENRDVWKMLARFIAKKLGDSIERNLATKGVLAAANATFHKKGDVYTTPEGDVKEREMDAINASLVRINGIDGSDFEEYMYAVQKAKAARIQEELATP